MFYYEIYLNNPTVCLTVQTFLRNISYLDNGWLIVYQNIFLALLAVTPQQHVVKFLPL